jgi:phosphoesterase RecJ-like protein
MNLEKYAELIANIAQRIQDAKRILVVSHIRPDGDAVGSVLGLGLALIAAGKEVRMVLSDGVPPAFHHLPGVKLIHYRAKGEFDLSCVVDCSDMQRIGKALGDISRPSISIDHHITNTMFAEINLVDPGSVATAEMLANILPAAGLPVTQEVASALLTGIVTDTLGFRTSNITPEALRIAADLMEMGANLPELYERSLINRTYEATRFWGSGLSTLNREDDIAWVTLTMEDRKAAGYQGKDDADLINVLSGIEGVKISLVFVEQPEGRVKVSWRAKPGYDVSQIALRFGGGGHPAASGADIPGSLDQVQEKVLAATHQLLNEQGSPVIANAEIGRD